MCISVKHYRAFFCIGSCSAIWVNNYYCNVIIIIIKLKGAQLCPELATSSMLSICDFYEKKNWDFLVTRGQKLLGIRSHQGSAWVQPWYPHKWLLSVSTSCFWFTGKKCHWIRFAISEEEPITEYGCFSRWVFGRRWQQECEVNLIKKKEVFVIPSLTAISYVFQNFVPNNLQVP